MLANFFLFLFRFHFEFLCAKRVQKATLCSSSETTSPRPSNGNSKLMTQIDVEALIAHVDCILIPHYHANYISLHAGTSAEEKKRRKKSRRQRAHKNIYFPPSSSIFFVPPLKAFVSAFFRLSLLEWRENNFVFLFGSPAAPSSPDNLFTPHSRMGIRQTQSLAAMSTNRREH